jgi:hypothetical protein
MQIVRRANAHAFTVLPRRRVVERALSWNTATADAPETAKDTPPTTPRSPWINTMGAPKA